MAAKSQFEWPHHPQNCPHSRANYRVPPANLDWTFGPEDAKGRPLKWGDFGEVLGLGFSGHAPLNGSRSKPADVPTPLRSEPPHKRDTGNNKEEIKTESTKPFPKPLPTEQGDTQLARQWVYSEFGERAFAAGQRAVYLGSKPYQAWLSYRGKDGMPGFVDRAIINGKVQEIVWMPSLYPPRRSADESEGGGGWSNL